jgi:hypothetical protein
MEIETMEIAVTWEKSSGKHGNERKTNHELKRAGGPAKGQCRRTRSKADASGFTSTASGVDATLAYRAGILTGLPISAFGWGMKQPDFTTTA